MTRRPKTCAPALLLSGVEHPTLSRSFLVYRLVLTLALDGLKHLCRRCPRNFSRIPDCDFCAAVADSLSAAVLWCFHCLIVLGYLRDNVISRVGFYDGTGNQRMHFALCAAQMTDLLKGPLDMRGMMQCRILRASDALARAASEGIAFYSLWRPAGAFCRTCSSWTSQTTAQAIVQFHNSYASSISPVASPRAILEKSLTRAENRMGARGGVRVAVL